MISKRTKIITIVGAGALASGMALNFNFSRTNDANLEKTMVNVVTLAEAETMGSFPSCQKRKGTGGWANIPFCNNDDKCVDTYEAKGVLDVNRCTENPK